jgi:sulfur relay (sulfurtransferase) DsrF/TusC family protein
MSLRDRCIEAVARRLHPVAWRQPHNTHEAEAALDAILAVLAESADEYQDLREAA